jgi:hypothetical protein
MLAINIFKALHPSAPFHGRLRNGLRRFPKTLFADRL